MYNEKTTRPMRRRNEIKELKVFLKGKTFKFEYDINALVTILKMDVYNKIQIPVYMHNSTLFGEGKKGITVVGNVVAFNSEDGTMTVNIFSKFTSKVNALADAIVFPRVAEVRSADMEREENDIVKEVKVLGLDIVSESFCSALQ